MSTFADAYVASNIDKFPAESLPYIRERVAHLDQHQSSMLLSTKIKSPKMALLLSFLVGGFAIDRFYIGQIGMGILKLGVTLLLWFVFLGWIWTLVDLFLIMGATRKENLKKVVNTVNSMSYSQNNQQRFQ